MKSKPDHHPSENKPSHDNKLDLSQIDIIKPNPNTGTTTLPEWMDSPEDDGLYDDLV